MAEHFTGKDADKDALPLLGGISDLGGIGSEGIAFEKGAAARSHSARKADSELFLLFSVAGLGQCVLPIEAVQVVASADGPFRSVPGCGVGQSRFLGLVSVRGQVQLLFDLANLPDSRAGHSSVLGREEHLVVAVAADGQTLALRVTEPLRLVRRLSDGAQAAPQGVLAPLVCGSFCVSEPAGTSVWLLAVEALFEFLKKEVRNG